MVHYCEQAKKLTAVIPAAGCGDRWGVFSRVVQQNYSPRCSSSLIKMGFPQNNIWRIYRILKQKRPQNAWRYGKLWGLYLMVSNIEPFGGTDYGWPENQTGDFTQMEDETQDIDTQEDYLNLLASQRCHKQRFA